MEVLSAADGQCITRRGFMGGAAAFGLASVLGAMGARTAMAAETGAPSTNSSMNEPPTVNEEDIVETVDCDIVVVGAGVAGMAAIMYASAQGANVHVLEKNYREGVHRLCVAGLNPKFFVEQMPDNVIDTVQYAEDFYRCSAGFNAKMPLITRYAKDSGMWIDWLYSEVTKRGWSLVPKAPAAITNIRSEGDHRIFPSYNNAYMFEDDEGRSTATGHSPNWMELFREIAEDYGANFHFNEPGYILEREEGDRGRVTGVISKSNLTGEYRRYNAKLGVLLAAGDFYNDKEMVHKYCSFLEKCTSSIAEPNNTGDMHKAGMWVGAAMDDYSAGDLFGFQNVECKNWISPRPGDDDYTSSLEPVRGTMWAAGLSMLPLLWVDDGGRRFVNEGIQSFQQAGAHNVLCTPTGKAWTIWDGAWQEKLPEGWQTTSPCGGFVKMMSCPTEKQMEREVEEGLIVRCDTIEELAVECGFDPEYFKATVERYNYLCERGEDIDCCKESTWMIALDTPPYYAAHWGVMITSTRCGLKTDEFSHVLDTKNQVIPGLYAAGNNGGNFYGINYPGSLGGTGIGHGQFFSWVAARDMLGEEVIYTEEA